MGLFILSIERRNKVSMGNENFFGKKIESDFLNTKRKRGGNHDEGQANVQS